MLSACELGVRVSEWYRTAGARRGRDSPTHGDGGRGGRGQTAHTQGQGGEGRRGSKRGRGARDSASLLTRRPVVSSPMCLTRTALCRSPRPSSSVGRGTHGCGSETAIPRGNRASARGLEALALSPPSVVGQPASRTHHHGASRYSP